MREFDFVDMGGGYNLPLFEGDNLITNFEEFIDLSIPE